MKTISKSNLVELAKDFSFTAHSSQYYPCGRRYSTHLETVAHLSKEAMKYDSTLPEGTLLSTSFLHDTIEDTETTYDDLLALFGLEVAKAVSALSKNKNLAKEEQIANSLENILRQPKYVSVIKLADRIANLQQSIFLDDNKWGVDYKEYYRGESILINQTLGKASPYLSQKLSILINIYNRI